MATLCTVELSELGAGKLWSLLVSHGPLDLGINGDHGFFNIEGWLLSGVLFPW
jgi:hypothetical protein